MTVLMILLTPGPPSTFWTATLLMPYSIAWRSFRLAIAWLLLGLRRLNTTYGLVASPGHAQNIGSLLATSCWIALGCTLTSSEKSNVPAFSSVSCVCASVMPIVTWISLTYWCLSESEACDQAGFLVKT